VRSCETTQIRTIDRGTSAADTKTAAAGCESAATVCLKPLRKPLSAATTTDDGGDDDDDATYASAQSSSECVDAIRPIVVVVVTRIRPRCTLAIKDSTKGQTDDARRHFSNAAFTRARACDDC